MSLAGVRRNFTLLLIEVTKQIDDAWEALQRPSPEVAARVRARDDYVNVLKNQVTGKAFRLLLEEQPPQRSTADLVDAIQLVAQQLGLVAEHGAHIVAQMDYLSAPAFVHAFEPGAFFAAITPALRRVEESLFCRHVDEALRICRAEFTCDIVYKRNFDCLMTRLATGRDTGDLVTSLFILRNLERIGDALLRIGEAILSGAVGEKLRIHEYLALEESVGGRPVEGDDAARFAFEEVAETRSGSRIGRVRPLCAGDETHWVLFKEGSAAKLLREKEKLEQWREVMPGLPPRVLGFEEEAGNAYLLLEYLQGQTFQQIAMESEPALAERALAAIQGVLAELWERTARPEPVSAGFVEQLRRRLPDVRRVHPWVDDRRQGIGGLGVPSLGDLVEALAALEPELTAPFSVLIHGDLNADNVLVDPRTWRVNVVDVNRSCWLDPTQDVSVFLLSTLRLPVTDPIVRARLARLAASFYRFARAAWVARGDATFDARLTLGVVRSLITSTRFVPNRAFARALLLRARYLAERLTGHAGRPWESFVFPVDVLGG
jgi:aminoglycoside phosphotransferase (APT) family kinase protein/phosphate uptake regulator